MEHDTAVCPTFSAHMPQAAPTAAPSPQQSTSTGFQSASAHPPPPMPLPEDAAGEPTPSAPMAGPPCSDQGPLVPEPVAEAALPAPPPKLVEASPSPSQVEGAAPPAGSASLEGAAPPAASDSSSASSSSAGADAAAELQSALDHLSLLDAQLPGCQVQELLLASLDLEGVAHLILSGKARRIVCVCGAGISVSAGISDFRTPGTGLYSQLAKYKLPYPEAVFTLDFFNANPRPFHMLAKELFPGTHGATATHHFMRLLHDRGLLLRCFTQNIDSLETVAGLPREAVVPAHGNFDGAHCTACHKEFPTEYVREAVFDDRICTCDACGRYVKPDIVFFGEQLPQRFFERRAEDMPECDLLIVLGTSLVVQPFAGLVNAVSTTTPRLLINRERVGESATAHWGGGGAISRGFRFEPAADAHRDALFLGDCDAGVTRLAHLLGWASDLEALVAAGKADHAQRLAECYKVPTAAGGGGEEGERGGDGAKGETGAAGAVV